MLKNRWADSLPEVKAVSVSPAVSACYNFRHDGIESIRTVVIAPINVASDGASTRIGWACALGSFCDSFYRYSEAGRAMRMQSKQQSSLEQ